MSMPEWLAGRALPDEEQPCRLTLRHLSRAHLDLLCAYEGIACDGCRIEDLKKLEQHLTSQLAHDIILTPIVGVVPNCEYPTVVTFRPYELLLFGGSQATVAESVRTRPSSNPGGDALWHCHLLEGEWRTVPAKGMTPSARSGHSAVMYDNKMWVYGGWNDVLGEALEDMHVLHIHDNGMLWEQVDVGGRVAMEARAWHSVCVYGDKMLLYGDKGECLQSQSSMTTVYEFDFAKRCWDTIKCTGADHPEPQFVLAVTVVEDVMYTLCFTAGAKPDGGWDSATSGELVHGKPDGGGGGGLLRGGPGGAGDEDSDAPGTPASLGSMPNDSSFMEIFALNLRTRVWSKVPVTGHIPGGRYGCSATVNSEGKWVIHGGISRCQDYILSDTYEFDFRARRWTRLLCQHPLSCAPRTGHVGIAVDDSIVFVGGNSCATEPPPPPPTRLGDDHRRATLTSHGLHFPLGVNGAAPSNPLPVSYRGEGDVTFSRRAEVMWKRPREPSAHVDASVCNVGLLQGVRALAADAAAGPGPAGHGLPDVHITTCDGERLPSFRVLLAASASSFRAMFTHDMQEASSGEVAVDAPAQHVQWLLDYVHGTMQSIEGHMARPLFVLADQYGVAGLAHACQARLVRDLSADTVPAALELSDVHSCDALLHACVAFVRRSRSGLQSIVGTEGFVRLMQERPQKAQAFLLRCMPNGGAGFPAK